MVAGGAGPGGSRVVLRAPAAAGGCAEQPLPAAALPAPACPPTTSLPPCLPCRPRLPQVSAPHWNQDEEAGGFGGPHCMVVGGYDAIFRALADALGDCLHLGTPVAEARGRWPRAAGGC